MKTTGRKAMNKPLVFNYKRYEELRDAYKILLEENQSLKRQIKDLKADIRYLKKNLEMEGRIVE